MSRFNEIVTTLLDALALLAVSVGIGWAAQPHIGWAGALFLGGCMLATLSSATQHLQRPKEFKTAAVDQSTPPGPEDAGHLHVMGR